MIDYLIKRPMLFCAIVCSIISVTGFYSATLIFIEIALLAGIIGVLIITKKRLKHILAFIIMFLFGVVLLFEMNTVGYLQTFNKTTQKLDLTICENGNLGGDYNTAYAQVITNAPLKRGTKIYIFYEGEEIKVGQSISAELDIRAIDGEYKKSNYSREVYLSANVKEYGFISKKDDSVMTAVGKTRVYIKKTLFSNMSFSTAATMSALVFGEKGYFTDEFYKNVTAAGVNHIMVVSGLHLTVIVTLLTYIVNKILYNKYVRAFIISFCVIILTAICGFTISMRRAGITHILSASSPVLKQKGNSENTLGTAIVLILFISPFAVLSLAFQLSVASTFGILAVAIPIIRYFKERQIIKSKILLSLFTLIAVTFSATLLTLPITILNFGGVSTVVLITNLLLSYAVTAGISLAVVGLVLNLLFPVLAEPIFYITEIITRYINSVINYFGTLKFAYIEPSPLWVVVILLLIIFIFYYLLACKREKNMIKLSEIKEKLIKEGGKTLKWR